MINLCCVPFQNFHDDPQGELGRTAARIFSYTAAGVPTTLVEQMSQIALGIAQFYPAADIHMKWGKGGDKMHGKLKQPRNSFDVGDCVDPNNGNATDITINVTGEGNVHMVLEKACHPSILGNYAAYLRRSLKNVTNKQAYIDQLSDMTAAIDTYRRITLGDEAPPFEGILEEVLRNDVVVVGATDASRARRAIESATEVGELVDLHEDCVKWLAAKNEQVTAIELLEASGDQELAVRRKVILVKWKPFACTVCDFRFRQKGNAKTHIETCRSKASALLALDDEELAALVKLKPFLCTEPECNYRCSQNSDLKRHLVTHTKVRSKPYACGKVGCQWMFGTEQGARLHRNSKMHGGTGQPSRKKKNVVSMSSSSSSSSSSTISKTPSKKTTSKTKAPVKKKKAASKKKKTASKKRSAPATGTRTSKRTKR